MNFVKFSVGTTNIFPLANSTTGGQLMTEYNLRSRESVGTPEAVQYYIGPSYTHGEEDFKISKQASSSSILEISPGRAVVNGHFVESLVPVVIDFAAENYEQLSGRLVVGLKAEYNEYTTLAGALKADDPNSMFEGIQVVILPEEQFKLPTDVPLDENAVTAHLKLGEFSYTSNTIHSVSNNYPGKCQIFEPSRAGIGSDEYSDIFVSKEGLDPNRLYVFASRHSGEENESTWCDAMTSLYVWERQSALVTSNEEPAIQTAQFIPSSDNNSLLLVLPHKQVDGFVDDHDRPVYYQPVSIRLPAADYAQETAGVISRAYTQQIKAIQHDINRFASMRGKQILFKATLDDIKNLPPYNPNWNPGDYILVAQDMTDGANIVLSDATDASGEQFKLKSYPATYYVVQPRYVVHTGAITAVPLVPIDGSNEQEYRVPCDGVCLYTVEESVKRSTMGDLTPLNYLNQTLQLSDQNIRDKKFQVAESRDGTYYCTKLFRGVVNEDYFRYTLTIEEDEGSGGETTVQFYAKVTAIAETYDTPSEWWGRIVISPAVPLAQTTQVGGFLNLDITDPLTLGGGYVVMDGSGHLRLVDYDRLAMGEQAYRFGNDYTTENTLTIEALQEALDDWVNNRLVFPDEDKIAQTEQNIANFQASGGDILYAVGPGFDENIIELTVQLPADPAGDEQVKLNIHGLQSRFGGSVYLHLKGKAGPKTVISIKDCTKIRIDSSGLIGKAANAVPQIILQDSCLYYDADVIDKIASAYNTTLWYEYYGNGSDVSELVVDGMTVRSTNAVAESVGVDYWSDDVNNDNHISLSLSSITFDTTLHIVGCEVIFKNATTANLSEDPYMIYETGFNLVSTAALPFSYRCLNRRIRIEGSVVSAYPASASDQAMTVLLTQMCMVSQVYGNTSTPGSLAMFCQVFKIKSVGSKSLPSFNVHSTVPILEFDAPHILHGGVIAANG